MRYEEIESTLRPFLAQSGISPSKTSFVPVSATLGVNLIGREGEDAKHLNEWYSGPTLVDCLGMFFCPIFSYFSCLRAYPEDKMEPPARDHTRPFRLPISNIFKTRSMSGVYIAGRIAGGIVQIGEKVRVMPGDDSVTGIVQCTSN